MLNETTVNKIEALMATDSFRAELEATTCKEDLLALLNKHDVQVSEEEFAEMGEKGISILTDAGYIAEDGELAPELLEQFSGGGKWGTALVCFALAGVSAYCGQGGAAALFIIAGIATLTGK